MPTTRTRANQSGWVHPSVLSAELTCMLSRMMSEVGRAAPWSVTVTSGSLLLFVPSWLCTLRPLNIHLVVERMYRIENTGA